MQKKEVKVPSINFQTLLFEIQGKSPLLMNKPPITLDSDQEKNPDPYEVAKRGVYFNENGNVAIPCIYFIKSMINAARFIKRLKMAGIRGAFTVTSKNGEAFVDLIGDKEFEIHSFIGGSSKGKVNQAHQPMFKNWGCIIKVNYDAEVIDKSTIINLLQKAGLFCGVGGYRPNLAGTYGMFEISKIEIYE